MGNFVNWDNNYCRFGDSEITQTEWNFRSLRPVTIVCPRCRKRCEVYSSSNMLILNGLWLMGSLMTVRKIGWWAKRMSGCDTFPRKTMGYTRRWTRVWKCPRGMLWGFYTPMIYLRIPMYFRGLLRVLNATNAMVFMEICSTWGPMTPVWYWGIGGDVILQCGNWSMGGCQHIPHCLLGDVYTKRMAGLIFRFKLPRTMILCCGWWKSRDINGPICPCWLL